MVCRANSSTSLCPDPRQNSDRPYWPSVRRKDWVFRFVSMGWGFGQVEHKGEGTSSNVISEYPPFVGLCSSNDECYQDVAWIPMDMAVEVLRDLAFADVPSSQTNVFHLTHARPIKWSILMDYLSTTLNIPQVPFTEWLSTLQAQLADRTSSDTSTLQDIPVLKILPFFTSVTEDVHRDPTREAMGIPLLSIENAKSASPTLRDRNLRQLTNDDVARWLGYWEQEGFISLSN
jgi:hypothetical protein